MAKKIFIRLGHDVLSNGYFSGAVGIMKEKQVIDEVGSSLALELAKKGYNVKSYRSHDGTYSSAGAAARAGVTEATNWGADLFISCHANSFDDSSKNGTLVHYNEKGNSKDLASALCSAISNALGTSSLGVSTNSNLIEMNSTSMPAVLMEPIFISNQSDCDKYKKYTGKALGVALAQTVAKFI